MRSAGIATLSYLHSSRQTIARETPARVNFVDKHAFPHTRVVVHDRPDLVGPGIKDPNPGHLAGICNRADDGEQTFISEGEVPSSMFPDDRPDSLPVEVRAGLQDHDTVLLCLRNLLAHVVIGNCFHIFPAFHSFLSTAARFTKNNLVAVTRSPASCASARLSRNSLPETMNRGSV